MPDLLLQRIVSALHAYDVEASTNRRGLTIWHVVRQRDKWEHSRHRDYREATATADRLIGAKVLRVARGQR